MHMRSESHCPLCRNPYHHFPAICQTLHFLLKKLYPLSYKRRNIQLLEDEKQGTLGLSPDIDNLRTIEESNNLNNVGPSSDASIEDKFSVDCSSTKEKKFCESSSEISKQVSVNDVLCGACKQLLYRPVVLNCGHVYCEACIIIPTDGMLKCQVCECRHPSGLPKVCRELNHFIEEQFSSEYELRESTIQLNQDHTQNQNPPNQADKQINRLPFPTEDNFLQWWTVHGSKFHDYVGCDMCGMCPIIGKRYNCKDCKEKCGYDLCGDCYTTGQNLAGRFNQKHTPNHKMELVKPVINRDVIYRLLSGQLAIVSSAASRTQPSPANTSPSVDEDGSSAGPTESSSSASRDDENEDHGSI